MLSVTILALGGCSAARTDFPVRPAAVEAEVEGVAPNVSIIQLSGGNIEAFNMPRSLAGSKSTMPSGNTTYKVGVGDVLSVVVWEHPELTMPQGEGRSSLETGQRVQADGTFFYPYVGQIQAKGRTSEEIRGDLTTRLAEYIPQPQIEVRVVGYKSQAISVTGEVTTPSRQPITDTPLTLLDAISAAGGMSASADPRSIAVRRGNKVYPIDMQAFLDQGLSANNPVLQSGDVVSVPRIQVQEAYLLGQISTPSALDLTHDNLTLTQAITRSGGLNEDSADARGIFVFRDTDQGITVYQLDASNPVAYLVGTRFVVLPRDVIYVTTAPAHRWNRLISTLLPTISIVKATGDIKNF